MIGGTVAGYRLLGPFGNGAGLYRAASEGEGRPVLLLLTVPERPEPEAAERFRRTAVAATETGHPAILPLLAAGTLADGRLFAAFPVVEGETLEDRLVRGPLPPVEALGVALAVADVLKAARTAGLVHGDLRPDRVLLTPGGLRLLGFGLGETAAPGPAFDEGATVYRAPERLAGAAPGPRADVWALGVLLYEMLAGRPPFGGSDDTEEERAAAVAALPPAPLPSPPRGLEGILLRALRKRPEDRWRDAGALAAALSALPGLAAAGGELAPTLVDLPVRPGGAGSRSAASAPASIPFPGGVGRDVESYRLGERLGSGGMAVVFRAEDLRLGRTVALKFLIPELSRDPAAKHRFLREARALSGLDHPNLCTIHEVGETADGQIFIAMPCYEGETLRRRIQRGPLAPDEAIDLALQAAQGLAKAHKSGIVHRDVKPANLMVTADGVVKILDFGLAKLAGTTSAARKETGGGTLAYMSPEQTLGEDVDGRADLWSLGVVLYEMLTGLKPFRADRDQGVLYAIRNTDPVPLPALCPEVPAALAELAGRLLAKDPAGRPASADALVAELRGLQGGAPAGEPVLLAAPPLRRGRGGRRAAAGAALLAVVALGGLLAWRTCHREAGGSGPVEVRFEVLTGDAGIETFPSLSPDGEFFVYAKESGGDMDVFWQRTGGGNPQNLTEDSPGTDTQPALSPDKRWIAFRSERDGGGLFLMGATGESARRLTSSGFNPSWSPDSRSLVFATESVSAPGGRATTSELWRLDVATLVAQRLETGGDAVQPSWSPDGRRIAYWRVRAGSAQREIWTLPAAGGEPELAVAGKAAELLWCPVWSPEGRHLYFAADRSGAMGLWRVRIDARSGAVRSEPQQILVPATWSALPSLSADGRIAFVRQEERSRLVRATFDPALDPTGSLRELPLGARSVGSAHVSADGLWLVYATTQPQEDLFLMDTASLREERLTDDAVRDRVPRWSAPGRRIVFYSERGGEGYEAWVWRRGAPLERLTAFPEKVLEPVVSPDGTLLAASLDFHGPFLIDLRKPLTERAARPLQTAGGATPPPFGATSWSPDGRHLAGFDEQGRIVLYSFATRRLDVLAERGTLATWLGDNRTLLFLRGGALWALDTATRRAREVLTPPADAAFSWFTTTPDGRDVFLVQRRGEADLGMLTLR